MKQTRRYMWFEEGVKQPLQYLFHQISSKMDVSVVGAMLGAFLPVPLSMPACLALLVGIDTYTGRLAAFSRGDAVNTSRTREMALKKLQGYMIFITTAALAAYASGDMILLKGSISLLSTIEFFSIAENLYDCKYIPFNPKEAPIFKGISALMKRRKGD